MLNLKSGKAVNLRTLAAALDVSAITLHREIDRGNLHATRVGRRVVILPDEVARYLKSNTGEPSHERLSETTGH